MSIMRIKHVKNYFSLANDVVNNSTISFKAKGILAYLLSKPDDWEVQISDLVNHATEGEGAVRSGIKELISAGYVTREASRGDDGRIVSWNYTVSEEPQRTNPDVDFPDVDRIPLQSTESNQVPKGHKELKENNRLIVK